MILAFLSRVVITHKDFDPPKPYKGSLAEWDLEQMRKFTPPSPTCRCERCGRTYAEHMNPGTVLLQHEWRTDPNPGGPQNIGDIWENYWRTLGGIRDRLEARNHAIENIDRIREEWDRASRKAIKEAKDKNRYHRDSGYR